MMAPPPAPAVSGPLAVLDPTGQFAKRKKTSLWFTVALLVVSVFILTIGLAATTRTENVTVGGYYPGIVLGFGSFLGIVGIHLVENRRQMGRAEGEDNLPRPAGHALLNAAQDTIGLPGHEGTLLAHGELVVHQDSQVLLHSAASQQVNP
ncbi:transmembrane protein 255B [Grus japonensis]|uniref:Transmembrane protein 255B n=1 Tax=Grus japonensis TaxID=30415 RepID=A0ABC9W1R4_GRUJA